MRKEAEERRPARRAREEAPSRTGRRVALARGAGRAKTRRAPRESKFADVRPIREAMSRRDILDRMLSDCQEKCEGFDQLRERDQKAIIMQMMQTLGECIVGSVKPRACGKFVLPGLLRVVTIHKPATKARKGINPFTKEPTVFKAKPARNIVRVRVGKELKEAVI